MDTKSEYGGYNDGPFVVRRLAQATHLRGEFQLQTTAAVILRLHAASRPLGLALKPQSWQRTQSTLMRLFRRLDTHIL